ncbi:CPBP family intramembrane glutamic endopeptidase [Oceanobacillus damuensis]|uniref:CPBP family intramembrane glutamic endopeptidase n=1 Tax=Oceanobacillus damuensis TaxID=937928 RepID=UPI00082E5AD6|nr:CPBP family intramembrane glutamic endopeptidase [Oceanobacillus damuensis]
MKQSEIIKQLSDKELKKQLYLSQSLFILISILLSFVLFDNFSDWLHYFDWNVHEILTKGILSGLIIVLIDLAMIYILPKNYYDDDGINERIFSSQSVSFILFFSFFVAVSEELLFRGVIQTEFGYIAASLLFAIVHIRYMKKPVLFISILFVSFYIGYLYELTNNLLVTITAHFCVDFLLGLVIRLKK